MEGRGKSVNWNKVASMGLDMQLGALKINSAVTRGAGNETKSLGLDGTHTEGMDRHVQVANRAWSGTHGGSTRGRPPAQCTWKVWQSWARASLQSMAELDEISHMQSHFSLHFLLIFLIYLVCALAILCKLGREMANVARGMKHCTKQCQLASTS